MSNHELDIFKPDVMNDVKKNLTIKTTGIFNQLNDVNTYDVYKQSKKEIKEAKATFNKLIKEVDTARIDAKNEILASEKALHGFTKSLKSDFESKYEHIKLFEEIEFDEHVDSINELILNEIMDITNGKAVLSPLWDKLNTVEPDVLNLFEIVLNRLPRTIYNVSTPKSKVLESVLGCIDNIEKDYDTLCKYIPDALDWFIKANLNLSQAELLYKSYVADLDKKDAEPVVVNTKYTMQDTKTFTLEFNANDENLVVQLLTENNITFIKKGK